MPGPSSCSLMRTTYGTCCALKQLPHFSAAYTFTFGLETPSVAFFTSLYERKKKLKAVVTKVTVTTRDVNLLVYKVIMKKHFC